MGSHLNALLVVAHRAAAKESSCGRDDKDGEQVKNFLQRINSLPRSFPAAPF